MIFSNDPLRDYYRYEAEQEDALKDLPHCADCGEPIQEYGYDFSDYWICDDCIEAYRKRVY